jgi:hypothetical protein
VREADKPSSSSLPLAEALAFALVVVEVVVVVVVVVAAAVQMRLNAVLKSAWCSTAVARSLSMPSILAVN